MNTEQSKKPKKLQSARSVFTYLRRYLITGIAVTSPLAITIWVLWGLFSFVDSKARSVLGKTIAGVPGVGVLIFFLLILLVGIFATNLIGKRMLSLAERVVSRIPLANKIYAAVQEISTAFLGSKRSIFSTVVLVEYPRKGLYSLGFVTSEGKGEVQDKTAEHVVGVFVPTTPNPTSGLLVFVPKDELIYLNMTTEDGLKLVISGGVFTPAYNSKAIESPKTA
ncbi:DUF502 domain-containing protein [Candidatus Poribacteria bacterium]|nr:DUF502 domain-containing protein [Candidatus Poribacteria bacterium]